MAHGIEVPLELEGFKVVDNQLVDGFIQARVESTQNPFCTHCGSLDVTGHGRHLRRIRDRACSYPTVLLWRQRRVKCRDCGRTSRERHPDLAGRRSITKRFHRHLYDHAIHRPFADVGKDEHVTRYRVVEAFDSHSQVELSATPPPSPSVISMDESSFQKRYRYMTVLFSKDDGAFEAFEGRSDIEVREGLKRLAPQVRAGIKVVVIDLHWPYRRAAEVLLPNAVVVADKFHILIAVDKAASRARRRLGRRRNIAGPRGGMDRGRHPRFERQVLDTKWIFHKRRHRLTAEDQVVLEALFGRFPQMRVIYELREQFHDMYLESKDSIEAEVRFEKWLSDVQQSGISEFKNLLRMLQAWKEPILAYFDHRHTNGFAEGLTNRIKVLKRVSYGLPNPERYRRKILLACGRRRNR